MNIQEKNIFWYYNINKEQEWNQQNTFPSVTDLGQLKLVIQQEQQMLYAAKPYQTVLLRHRPDKDFMDYLHTSGVEIPQIEFINDLEDFKKVRSVKQKGETALLVPYIVTEDTMPYNYFNCDYKLVKKLNNKFYVRELLLEKGFTTTRGAFCHNTAEILDAYSHLQNEGFNKFVFKIPFGSSGKGLKVVKNERELSLFIKFINRRSQNFRILLEGWHTIKHNLNSQILITDKVELLLITEQRITEDGMYLGTNFSPNFSNELVENYSNQILKIGELIKQMGYTGILGIDSIIDSDNILYPVVEINARFTQVTYLYHLVNKIKKLKFQFIESRFIRFESSLDVQFNEIKQYIDNQSKTDYFIYCYAKEKLKNKTLYRVFILFYTNDKAILDSTVSNFNYKTVIKV
ncbi:ATP-grasp domain-containing protein [Bacillus cereus]|uniref:ATP-grasp domain-containing protein n=1 Tax=Bacillus cereus TaxID=1396 RepID=UPI0009449E55|nr:ATP-grasp domain-containing protein [Bacillus cereus]